MVLNRWFATHFSFCADFLAPRKNTPKFCTEKLFVWFLYEKAAQNFLVKSTPDLEQRCLTRNIPVAIFATFEATVSQLRKYTVKTAIYKTFPLQISFGKKFLSPHLNSMLPHIANGDRVGQRWSMLQFMDDPSCCPQRRTKISNSIVKK